MAVKNGLYHVPRELDISRKTKRKAWELKALIVFNNLSEKKIKNAGLLRIGWPWLYVVINSLLLGLSS